MVRVYTGYFAQLNKYKGRGLFPIAICGKSPEFFRGVELKCFAPTWDIYSKWKNKEISDEEYSTRFKNEILDKLEPKAILNFFDGFCTDIVLLCYETPEKFCHRHLVSEWLCSIGINSEEYIIKEK